MIFVQNLTFSYDSARVFSHLDLEIPARGVTMIIGENGSGKSTLCELLSGLIFPRSGQISLDSLKITRKTPSKTIRTKVGLVLQDPNAQIIFPKVSDDLRFALENLGFPDAEISSRISSSLAQVNLVDFADKNPYELSGGQKQRLAIASQLALGPDYLILDEATSQLDIKSRTILYHLIRKLSQNIGVIFATNNISELMYADQIIILSGGEAHSFSLVEILRNPEVLSESGLDLPFELALARELGITSPADFSKTGIMSALRQKIAEKKPQKVSKKGKN